MTLPGAAFAPFFSHLQLDRLHTAGIHEQPSEECLCGALLFLDIVGFSSVTEELAKKGPRGAEILSNLLHAYFEPVLATIRSHGGDVLFFAGDAVLVLWKAESNSELDGSVARACHCALEIQSVAGSIEPPWGQSLRFRAALGAGGLEALELGGVGGRWLQVVRGEALDRCRRADSIATPMEVTIGDAVLQLLAGSEPVTTSAGHDGHHRLTGLGRRPALRPLSIVEPSKLPADSLSSRLPEVIARRLQAHRELAAEFRQVTVLFLNLRKPAAAKTDFASVDTLQEGVVVAQEQLVRFGGVLYQLLEDDKGANLIAVFGLPGASHADDAVRALRAGREIHDSLGDLGLPITGGIATGSVYCGFLGDDRRRRYSVIGSTVNLAARLMGLAGERGLLCDSPTRKLAGDRIEFAEAGWTTPKGFSAPVAMFAPGGEVRTEPETPSDDVVVGREEQTNRIRRAMDAVIRDGGSRFVLVRAEAGMGKSTLIQVARRLAADRVVGYTKGRADSFETGTAFYAFREVVRDWFEILPEDDSEAAQGKVERALVDMPDKLPLVPLLDAVIGVEMLDTPETAEIRGEARAREVLDLLIAQAVRKTSESPMVLVLEDGHWLDEASWGLISELLARVSGILLILTTRPLPDPPPEMDSLLALDGIELINLPAFDRGQTEELIRGHLGVAEVSAAALDFIVARAEGNPFYAREVIRSLKETGGIRIRSSRVELTLDEGESAPLPATLEGVITSRIDRLDPDVQITVKVAAVLGRSFDPDLLAGIHPAEHESATLAGHLATLYDASLVARNESGEHEFTHALTHEAAYNLLSFAQRESLHRAAGEWLESAHSDSLEQISARLGYHFRMARLPERAIPHLATAGEAAIDAYASRDAIEFLEGALDLDEEVRGELDVDARRARWCRLIGQAHYNQDRQIVAGEWYRKAIAHAGGEPRSRLLSATGILARSVVDPRRIGDSRSRAPDAEARARLLEGLAAGRELSVVYMWENALGKFALNSLNQARLARIVGLSEESADANATLGFLISSAGLHERGERVTLQAVQMAEEAGDLRQLVSVLTIAGMLFEQNGDPARGLQYLERCNELAADMKTGMYRHRARYMMADTLAVLGRWDESRAEFGRTAELARGVEPHAVGMANAMIALTHLRQGRIETAINVLEGPDGVASVLEGGVGISVVTGLGVLAAARLDLGDRDAALEAVQEAEAWMADHDDGTAFYSSIFGHSAIAAVRLATGEPGAPTRNGVRRKTPLDLAISRVARIRRMAPGAGAWLELLRGWREATRGKPKKARRLLRKAIDLATAAGQPYELGRGLVELASLSEAPERGELLGRATQVFEEYGMALELGRAQTLLRQEQANVR